MTLQFFAPLLRPNTTSGHLVRSAHSKHRQLPLVGLLGECVGSRWPDMECPFALFVRWGARRMDFLIAQARRDERKREQRDGTSIRARVTTNQYRSQTPNSATTYCLHKGPE